MDQLNIIETIGFYELVLITVLFVDFRNNHRKTGQLIEKSKLPEMITNVMNS